MIMKTLMVVTILLALVLPARADWNVGDPYKMHYPQLPKQGGWDVEFSASKLADDWQCTGTGAVSDIHFWVSWMTNLVQPINSFTVSIYSDIPAQGTVFSRPGQELWGHNFVANEFTIRDMPLDPQGWYDPSETGAAAWGLNDHERWQQINITNITNPWIQQQGTIYWLVVDFGTLPFVGWKESGSPHFNDDAVWWNDRLQVPQWQELRDPITQNSLDLAFVITPEPATLCLLAAGIIGLRKFCR
jgi:hypothetical protein